MNELTKERMKGRRGERTKKETRKKEKQEISATYTIAPAYNKGAYQVISSENIKDIGR